MNAYSGLVLTPPASIRELTEFASRFPLSLHDPMFDPEFFIASVSKGWRPRFVAVSRASDMVGLMYAKERVIRGIPTGVVYADGSLNDCVLSAEADRQMVFRVAAEALLANRSIHGLRLRVRRNGYEIAAVREITKSSRLDTHYCRLRGSEDSNLWKYDAHLSLPESYEQFLSHLNSTTRQNFRRYRRRFERSGHSAINDVSVKDLTLAVNHLAGKSKFKPDPATIQADLRIIAATRWPLVFGLKHCNGEWLSVVGGWYTASGGTLLFQYNNDREFERDSLSLVLRAHLIEYVIGQGVKELVFLGGTGPPLSRYVTYYPMIEVRLDVPSRGWRAFRCVLSKLEPLLPGSLSDRATSIAPPR